MRKILKAGLVTLLLGVSQNALAQSDFWTGTWDATYAELRLKQNGDFVYGDYGNWGVIEGILVNTARGEALRARFTRDDGKVGYMEWVESGDDGNRFTGRWVYEGAAMPKWTDQSLTRWRGTRVKDDSPTLTKYSGNGARNTMLAEASREYRSWVNAPDMNASNPWTGTWNTVHGTLRLQSNGSYVHGDYGDIGTIYGVSRKVGNDQILRARFKRNDNGLEGYVEWKSDGKFDHTLEGRWTRRDSDSLPVWHKGAGEWTATRTNAARPSLTTFTGSYGQQAILGSDPKYREWVKFETPKKSRKTINTRDASQLVQSKPTWREKIPALEDWGATFEPKYVEISLERLSFNNAQDLFTREAYGLIGIYASCKTDTQSEQINPAYGKSNKVWDVPRRNAAKAPVDFSGNVTTRRFKLPESCLNDPTGRISIQIQSNLKEKDATKLTDEVFGYLAGDIFLDDIPTRQAFGNKIVGPSARDQLVTGPRDGRYDLWGELQTASNEPSYVSVGPYDDHILVLYHKAPNTGEWSDGFEVKAKLTFIN